MKRIALFMLILFSGIACDKYHDPTTETERGYYFSFLTAHEDKLPAGSLVSDSVRLKVTKTNSSLKTDFIYMEPVLDDTFNVVFEVTQGGGTITRQSAHTDKYGIASIGWTLGTLSCEQKLRAKVYDLQGKYLSYSDLTEYGFTVDRWDAYQGFPEGRMVSMATDTINKVTFMIAGNTLYKQGANYYTWNGVFISGIYSPTSVNIDKNGVFYVNNGSGSLVKSIDHGNTWTPCVNPYNDQANIMSVYVSNDNYIWAGMVNHNTRFSKDGGLTWNNAGNEVSIHGPGNYFRLKDGSILFHGYDCCSLYRSVDDGLTWIKIATPGPTVKLFVSDKNEILICTSENGLTIYRSTDNAANFNKVFSTIPDGLPPMDHTFLKWHNLYYVLIPGWGIFISSDLIHYQEFWFNANLGNLFIDHNGTLIAKDKNGNTVYYFKSSV